LIKYLIEPWKFPSLSGHAIFHCQTTIDDLAKARTEVYFCCYFNVGFVIFCSLSFRNFSLKM